MKKERNFFPKWCQWKSGGHPFCSSDFHLAIGQNPAPTTEVVGFKALRSTIEPIQFSIKTLWKSFGKKLKTLQNPSKTLKTTKEPLLTPSLLTHSPSHFPIAPTESQSPELGEASTTVRRTIRPKMPQQAQAELRSSLDQDPQRCFLEVFGYIKPSKKHSFGGLWNWFFFFLVVEFLGGCF